MEHTTADEILLSFLDAHPLIRPVIESYNRSILSILPSYIEEHPILFNRVVDEVTTYYKCSFTNIVQEGERDPNTGNPIWPFMARRRKQDYILKQYADVSLYSRSSLNEQWELIPNSGRKRFPLWNGLNMLGAKSCWLSKIPREIPAGVRRRYLDIDPETLEPLKFEDRDYSLGSVQDFRSVDEDPLLPLGYFISMGQSKAVTFQEGLSMNVSFRVMDTKVETAEYPKGGELLCDMRSMSPAYEISHVKVVLARITPLRSKIPGLAGYALNLSYHSMRQKATNVINMMRLAYLFNYDEYDTLDECISQFRQYWDMTTSIRSDQMQQHNVSTIENAQMMGNDTQLLKHYASLIGIGKYDVSDTQKDPTPEDVELMKQDFNRYFYPHIPSENLDSKFHLMLDMGIQAIKLKLGIMPLSNKDHYGTKRMNDTGNLCYTLTIRAYNVWVKEYMKKKQPDIRLGDYTALYRSLTDRFKKVTAEIHNCYSKSLWGVSSSTQKAGIVQMVTNITIASMYGTLRRIGIPMSSKNNKAVKPKTVDATQAFNVCVAVTPDSSLGGLVKQLSITAIITFEESDELLLKRFEDYPIQKEAQSDVPIYVNGNFCGYSSEPRALVAQLIAERRHPSSGQVSKYTSVVYSPDQDSMEVKTWIRISTSSGRLVRPLLVVGPNNVPLYKSFESTHFETLLLAGAIEFLDAAELEWSSVAITEEELTKPRKFDYLELHPVAMLSIEASMMNLANYNTMPRVAYTANMKKQYSAPTNLAYLNQMETGTKVLRYPQRALLQTVGSEAISLADQPGEQNAVVAILPSDYNMEDAVEIRRGFLQLGGLSSDSYDVIGFDVDKASGETLGHSKYPQGIVTQRVPATVTVPKVLRDEDGNQIGVVTYKVPSSNPLATQNTPLVKGDIVGCKSVPDPGSDEGSRPDCSSMTGLSGVVDKIWVTDHGPNKKTNYRIRIRSLNIKGNEKDIGDKVYADYSQKGVIGMVVNDEDMPRDSNGIPMDIIINTHSFPSRMTMGYLLDMIFGLSVATPNLHEVDRINNLPIPQSIRDAPIIPGLRGKKWSQLQPNERRAVELLFSRDPVVGPLLSGSKDFKIPDVVAERKYKTGTQKLGDLVNPVVRMAYEAINGKLPRVSDLEGKTPVMINATPFGDPQENQLRDAQELLKARGFSGTGKTVLYSGITGRMLGTYLNNPQAEIQRDIGYQTSPITAADDEDDDDDFFSSDEPSSSVVEIGKDFIPAQVTVGIISYKALKHVVSSKIRSRDIGKNNILTGQAIKGRSQGGGLQQGEMEVSLSYAHGAFSYINGIMHKNTDPSHEITCRTCQNTIYLEKETNQYVCSTCGDEPDAVKLCVPKSLDLLRTYWTAMGIKSTLTLGNQQDSTEVTRQQLQDMDLS
jgi:DNA-directed RNA polymerase beta subunit